MTSVVIIGCGRQGLRHATMAVSDPTVSRIALVDPLPHGRMTIARSLPIPVEHFGLTDAPPQGMDIGIVATPPDQTRTAIEWLLSGPHPPQNMLLEKPLAFTGAEARLVTHLLQGVNACLGLQYVTGIVPEVLAVSTDLDLGAPTRVDAAWTRRDGVPDWGFFRSTDCMGASGDLLPHLLGLCVAVLPQLQHMSALGWRRLSAERPYQDDQAAVTFLRGDGSLGAQCNVAWRSPGISDVFKVLISCERGVVTVQPRGADGITDDTIFDVCAQSTVTGYSTSRSVSVLDCYLAQWHALTSAEPVSWATSLSAGSWCADALDGLRTLDAADPDDQAVSLSHEPRA